jgi:hypothetical protein
MKLPVSRLLLFLGAALVLFPLGIHKPGLPTSTKADEPAYYMMAQSLAKDLDLVLELTDIRRLLDEFPYLPVNNVILMSDDGWRTAYFGKPYIYPLVAAPAAALFGANGMVALNMAMLMGMIWLGFVYLRRYNGEGASAVFVIGFFVLSSAFAYTQWLHPEIFNMFSAALCLFFVFHRFDAAEVPASGWRRWAERASRESLAPVWSGAALALGFYNKPMLLGLALPAVYVFWRRGGWRRATAWLAAFASMLALVCGLAILLTGHASAYLGVLRAGITIESQDELPELPVGVEVEIAGHLGQSSNSWEWLARLPELDLPLLAENSYYFLLGRHTGLFVYMPFALVALVLFLVHERRSLARWLVVVALATIAVYFLVFIYFNWHGGGGFVGNRYFVIVYPAFLFLVTNLRPAWLTGLGYAAGALYLGAILATPFGSPVRKPTLQAHVRGPAYRLLPIELSLRSQIPGYWGEVSNGAWFWGRKDVFDPHGSEFLVHGATTVEVWMMVTEPIEEAVFQVRNPAPSNRVRLSLGGDTEILHFGAEGSRNAVLRPRRPYTVRPEEELDNVVYRLLVSSSTSQLVELAAFDNAGNPLPPRSFPLGARIAYLGSSSDLEQDLYHAEWTVREVPEHALVASTFEVRLEVRNRSAAAWPARGPTRVRVSYHWRDLAGQEVVREGIRTELPGPLGPGEAAEIVAEVLAPPVPGRYLLELDLLRERVAWFSRDRPESVLRLPIEVIADPPAGEIGATAADAG